MLNGKGDNMNIFQTIYNNTKIRCIFAVCICLWIAVMVQVMVTMAFEKERDITEAFAKEDNVDIRKCSIEGTACLNADRQSFDHTAVLLLENVQEDMTDNAACEKVLYSEEKLPCYKVSFNTDETDMSATVSWSDKMNQAYFHCNINIKGSTDRMRKVYDKLESIFDKGKKAGYISDDIIYSTIEAEKEGYINENDCIQYTESLFERLGAKRVTDGGRGYYTAYGYTPEIYNSIESKENSVNVQASYTYDEQKGATVISLGSPVLNSDY